MAELRGAAQPNARGRYSRAPMRARVALPLLLALLGPPVREAGEAAERAPNVLLVVLDDVGGEAGFLGGRAATPHLDALAARGVAFANAHCSAPTCNPSRTAMLLGRRPSSTGVYFNRDDFRAAVPDAVSLPRLFQEHGRLALACGKVFHGRKADAEAWEQFLPRAPDDGLARDPVRVGGVVWEALDAPDERLDDHRLVTWAAAELARPRERPFLLAVGLSTPHLPWLVPRRFLDAYAGADVRAAPFDPAELEGLPARALEPEDSLDDERALAAAGRRDEAVRAYLAAVSFADHELGRLLAALASGPHARDTLVVVVGDNGLHLGEKGRWLKNTLWEESTRVPLVVAGPDGAPDDARPRIARGARCERPVELVSLYATLAELAGLPVPAAAEGPSLAPLLADPDAAWPHAALTTRGFKSHAVRDERWRYVRWSDGAEELYDHAADPRERVNLAADPARAATIAELARHLPAVEARRR